MTAGRPAPDERVTARWRWTSILTLLGLYFTAIGVLGGMLVERMRFDVARGRILAYQAEFTRQLHARVMLLERATAGQHGPVTP